MKIAIHNSKGSFSDNWIEYCKENNIDFKIVNAYDNDIIEQVADCDAFMWHHHHGNYRDVLFAKQLLYSLEMSGKKVFPNFNTTWHFDDKVGQKYLFEAIGASLVPSYVFYNKADALKWVNETTFPKVFKLRGGAGAANVKLARTKRQAIKLINKCFGKGFPQFDRWNYFKERFNNWRNGKEGIIAIAKGVYMLLAKPEFACYHFPEKGYAYFQEFIPNNDCDFRIKIVNNKCWGFRREVRKNDFRASGSNVLLFDNELIPEDIIKISFQVYKKLLLQSVAFDFVIDKSSNTPMIIELSYGFGYDENEINCGYWTEDLQWHESKINPQGWMVEELI